MLRYRKLLIVLLIASFLSVTLFAQAVVAADQPSQEWTYSTGAYITASPIYQNNVLYVADQKGKLYSIYTPYGAPQWNFTTDNRTPSAIQGTPLVVTDQTTNARRIYFGSGQGTLFAIDGLTGKELWRFQADSSIDGTPTLYNGILFFGTFGNTVYALTAEDGKSQWNFTTQGFISDNIEARDNNIYFGSQDGNLYCVEVYTGKQKWKADLKSRVNSPVLDGDNVIVGTQDGIIHCLNTYSGNQQWVYQTGGGGAIVSRPLVQLNTVYVGATSPDGNVYALNETTGKLLWKFTTGDEVKCTPGFDSGILYIGSGDHNVYSVDARLGLPYWKYDAGNPVDTTPAVGTGTDRKKHLFFATVNGDVMSLQLPDTLIMATPTPKPKPTITATPVPSPTVTVTPTLVPLPTVTPEPKSSWCPLPGLLAAALAVVGIAYRRLK